ncbi:hypothetical protein [Candidatus Parabeggiatoa sp. HSG14]|uniref:hypothetical protein n=1 Tax=Candidatus Parabeggiatoa sp. HSG14 TaxID=3055593 RepID=UPI0025A7F9D9|nr:hypothetical protein [Thiotrichales bacterium HSG14]
MNGVVLSKQQVQTKKNTLNAMLQVSTKNSRGVKAGILGTVSNNCMGNNWYTKNRCGIYLAHKVQKEIDKDSSKVLSSPKKKQVKILLLSH